MTSETCTWLLLHPTHLLQLMFAVCRYYVVVAWIWAAIWYMALNPIKLAMAWCFDKQGFRTGKRGAIERTAAPKEDNPQSANHMGAVSRHNPMGRVSMNAPSAAQLERASVVRITPSAGGTTTT